MVLLWVGIASAYAQPARGNEWPSAQGQPTMSTGVPYSGTVYTPFDNTSPSEVGGIGANYVPGNAPQQTRATGNNRDRKANKPMDESPIGEPFVLVLFALLFAAKIFRKQHKKRLVTLLALVSVCSIPMHADVTALAFSPAAPQVGAQVTATPTIPSVPDGTVYVCWGVYSDAGCESQIDTIQFSASGAGNAVRFTAPATAGTYYIKCELRTGGMCSGITNNSYVGALTVSTQTPTGVEVTGDGEQATGARKMLKNGVFYFVKDGQTYDARGVRME